MYISKAEHPTFCYNGQGHPTNKSIQNNIMAKHCVQEWVSAWMSRVHNATPYYTEQAAINKVQIMV